MRDAALALAWCDPRHGVRSGAHVTASAKRHEELGLMESVQPYLDATWAFLSAGFNETNQAKPLLIALAATIFMQTWRQWFGVALLAVVVHIAVDVIVPVLAGQGEFRLPPLMTPEFWYLNASRYVGYLIVIAIFFAVKRVLFRGRAAAAH